ncbi:MAG: c-type cytochrome [Anaerolineae bacterium]
MKTPLNWRNLGLPIYVLIGLVIVFAGFVLYEMMTYDPRHASPTPEAVTETSYVDIVSGLLEGADPARGAQLIEQYGCVACHRAGAANNIAPAFVGIAERAPTRRPPMPASSYLYESITNPSAFVVEGFNNVMIPNFRERLSDRELGDIIAYLLTPEAH